MFFDQLNAHIACYFVDALGCVRAADQNMAAYNHPLQMKFMNVDSWCFNLGVLKTNVM